MPKNNNVRSLADFADEKFGKSGTAERERIEQGFEEFKLGVLIQEARKRKGLTQEQLAQKCGTNKAYISRVENGIKDVRCIYSAKDRGGRTRG